MSDNEMEEEEAPHSIGNPDKILYALIARGQTSLVDYSVREGNHVLLAQQILGKAKQGTVRRARLFVLVCLFFPHAPPGP